MAVNKAKSITLFSMMGLTVIGLVTYVFVFLPKQGGDTLGSKNLVLNSPVQKWNLRYSKEGIIPFGQEGREWFSIEVSDGSNVFSSTDGIVISTEEDTISIDVGDGYYIEYSPVHNLKVSNAGIVSEGSSMGNVRGDYLNIRIKDMRDRVYICPYSYFDSSTKDILSNAGVVLEKEIVMCEKESLDY